MSQVVVVDDNLKDQRLSSKKQEMAIDRDIQFNKWHLSDITQPSLILKLIGIVSLPIVIFWGIIAALGGAAVGFSMLIFKGISRLIPKSKG